MDMLKKILILLLALSVLFCFAACGEEPEETEPTLNPGDKNCEHAWSEWELAKEASCTKNGRRERSCQSCGKEEEEELLAYGHAYFDGICSDCGKTQKDCEHPETYKTVISEPTCYQSGESRTVCKLCKAVVRYNYLDPYWHDDIETVIISEPTCTEDGQKQEICKRCGEIVYQYTLWATGHENTEYVVITEATCTEDGWYQQICTLCGGVDYEGYIWSNGHSYEYIDSKAATCTEIGWNSYRKCLVCEYLYYYTERPATGHSYSFGTCVNCGVADNSFKTYNASGYQQSNMSISKGEATIYNAQTGFIYTNTGNIADKNTKEVWNLEVTIAGRYLVWLNEIYSGYYVKLYIYDSLGQRVANDGTIYNNEGLYVDLAVGTYTVEVHYGSGVTTYQYNVGMAKPSVDISAYGIVNDKMEFSRQKMVYTFTATHTGKYYFGLSEMTGNASLHMSIYNRLNERQAYDSYVNNGEGLSLEMTAGETYTIYVENNEGYKTNFVMTIGKQTPTVTIDGYNNIMDNMSFYGQTNVYEFVATSTDVRIDVIGMGASSQVDIYLYNYLGERIAYDTYCYNGEGFNSAKLVVGQTYTVKVIYRNEPTAYTLRVLTPENYYNIQGNCAVNDTMEYYGQINSYACTAVADGDLKITMRVDSYEGTRYVSIYVYDAAGNKLTSDDYFYSGDSVIIKNATAGAVYYVRVQSYTANMIYALEFH